MKSIPLSKRGGMGLSVIVDDCDVPFCEARRIFLGASKKYPHVTLTIEGKKQPVLLHRVLMGLKPHDGLTVDHINGNPLDNRRSNLRVVTVAQNLASRRMNRKNKIGFKGIAKTPAGRYSAFCCGVYGGTHDTAEAAARAYDALARKMQGEFAALNFPNDGEVSCLGRFNPLIDQKAA